MFDIELLYKNETGKCREDTSIEVLRMKGEYYLIEEQSVKLKRNSEGDGACFYITDTDYVEWLEEKIAELIQERNNTNELHHQDSNA